MASGFRINRQGVQRLQRDLQREFDKRPIRVPVEAGPPAGTTFPSPASTTVNHYNGPVVTVNGDDAQVAWNNNAVDQNQNRVEQIAPGYEQLAKVLAALLASIKTLELPEADAAELKSNADGVLSELTKQEPDQGLINRGVTMVKGLLAPIAQGVESAVSAESAEFARTVIESLGTASPF